MGLFNFYSNWKKASDYESMKNENEKLKAEIKLFNRLPCEHKSAYNDLLTGVNLIEAGSLPSPGSFPVLDKTIAKIKSLIGRNYSLLENNKSLLENNNELRKRINELEQKVKKLEVSEVRYCNRDPETGRFITKHSWPK